MSRIPPGARFAGRIALVPPKLSARMVLGSFRLSTRMIRRSVVLSAQSVRLAVRSSIVAFVLGMGVGWFLSTPTGRYVRASIVEALRPGPSGPPDDDALASAVRTDLAAAPSTWHLAQPEVTVAAGRVTLRGTAPHATGRDALLAVAAGVAGVAEVVDRLELEAAIPPDDTPPAGAATADPAPAVTTTADPADGTPTAVR